MALESLSYTEDQESAQAAEQSSIVVGFEINPEIYINFGTGISFTQLDMYDF